MIHKKNRSRRLSTLILIGFLCITMNMSTLSVFAYAESAGGGAQTGETTARSEILTRAESDYPKIEILGVQEEVSQVPEKTIRIL